MSARLPRPGKDHTNWGSILNEFLLTSHTPEGELRVSTVGTHQLQTGAVTAAKLDASVRDAVAAAATKYAKPETGIPVSDLADDVQALLHKASTALQPAVQKAAVDTAIVAPLATARTAAVTTATFTPAPNAPYYAPEDYGCAKWVDASINDAAIAAAIQDAIANNGVVQFTGDGPYNVSKAIDQDVSKFVVRGNKTMLDIADTFSGTYFWSLYSSADFPHSYNQGVAVSGITIQGVGLGSTPVASTALQIGHAVYKNNSLFSINEVYIQGFATGISYIDNAWRVKVSNSRVTGGTAISVAPGLANFGESMLVENCMIESYNPLVTIGSGEWNFTNCSFDNTCITVNGNCSVKLQGCHLEPHTVYPCVNVAHAQAMVTLDNTTLIVDPNLTINNAAFNVIDSNTTYGLIIRNLDTIQSAKYTPQVYRQNCVLVSGNGRVDIQGYSSNTNGYGYAIATSNNLIYNGDGEKGTTAGWTTYASYGLPSTFTSDNTVSKYGTSSLKLTANGGSTYVGQAVPCKPGQWVFAQCWNKFTTNGATGNTFINLDFLSAKGDVIKTIGYLNLTTTTDWVCRRQLTGTAPIAPVGTSSVRVYIGIASTLGPVSAWYDNIIVNVA